MIPSISGVHGGPSRALALMERALTQLGVVVETVTTDDDGPGRHNGKLCGVALQENGVTRRYFPKRTEFYNVAPGLNGWLARHARDYDLLHLHGLFTSGIIAAAHAARRASVPYIIRPLGTLSRYGVTQRRPWLKRASLALLEGPALRKAAAVHFTSHDEEREAGACGVPMHGVVIPLGIDPAVPSDESLVRARFPALGDAPYVLFLSRLDPKKNVEALLHALDRLSSGGLTVRLLVAGAGALDYENDLKALAAGLGLTEQVVWAGHVEGALKASALAGAAVFVLPSYSENFGIAAAEALMAGLPCLLGRGVAIATDVANARAGLAVPPDAASVAAALQQMLGDAPARAAMALAAVQLAQHHYSAQAMGLNLVTLYNEILRRPGGV